MIRFGDDIRSIADPRENADISIVCGRTDFSSLSVAVQPRFLLLSGSESSK